MYVSGIDLSLRATGVVNAPLPGRTFDTIPHRAQVIGTEGIEAMAPKDALRALDDLCDRIVSAAWASDIVKAGRTRPECVVIERPITGTAASRGVFERGYLWFSVAARMIFLGIDVVPVSVGTLKTYMTGRGTASKGAMIDAAARRLPMIETGGDDNLADAVAAAAFAAELSGAPLCSMPATHRRAVDAFLSPKPARKRATR